MSTTLTQLTFKSEAQRDLFVDVLERNELTEAQVIEQYPGKPGFVVLNLLLRNEREASNTEMQSRIPSEQQVSYLTALMEEAQRTGKTRLVEQAEEVLMDFSASMAKYSQAITVMKRFVTLPDKEERDRRDQQLRDELDAAILAGEAGAEEPF